MRYRNPIIKGFYPDPSVCFANGKFYMVCSSFQYFPGVPLFESENLINWKQIGHVLTRKSQVMLENVPNSGGVFAPTIRYRNGTFYMVTTNSTLHQNFYVKTNDIYSEWSEPIYVDQDGIDPSLFFENEKAYFISNGTDSFGESGVVQCEIDIESGQKLSESKCIWKGSGGRFLESPHMYKINGEYYLTAAEGGTEYGHMITYARSKSVWGEFEGYPKNPVLTNRNKAPNIIQGIGHGELIHNQNGEWFIVSLGFRQIQMWMPFHHLGREVFLTPVSFDENGWFTAGSNGTTDEFYDIQGDFEQYEKKLYTFENTDWKTDWCYLRHPVPENYILKENSCTLKATGTTVDEAASPTFLALRQRDFCGKLSCKVSLDGNGCEAGISVYMCETEHYDIAVCKGENGFNAVLKLNIGDIKHIQSVFALESNSAEFIIDFNSTSYTFSVKCGDASYVLGSASSKYLSSEISSPFTGVVFGLYAQGSGNADFSEFFCKYE